MYKITSGATSGVPARRTHELIKSAKLIATKKLWIDNFDHTKLPLSSEIINHIKFFINKSIPDIVFTHSFGDTLYDHKAVAASTIEAARFILDILL